MKRLSIITINLNNFQGLEKTILSVIQQTSSNYEFIIIDGGSTDGSVEIIKSYQNKITYWISEKDSGIYNAMNKGILKATGDYFIFLNSGDIFFNTYVIEKLTNISFNEDIIFGETMLLIKNKEAELLKPRKTQKKINSFYFLRHALPSHQSILFKKNLFQKYGNYNEDFKIISDAEFLTRIYFSKSGITQKYIPLFISIFDTSGISNNSKYDKMKYIERKKMNRDNFPYYLYIMNRMYQLVFILKKFFRKKPFS